MQLHERISLLRKVKGWTQEKMAENMHMSLHGYANIERGETDIQLSRLGEIAQIFGIELKELINFDEKIALNNIASPNSHNYIHSPTKDCENELEKANLIIEQQSKEIMYLKEIIALMKAEKLSA